MKHAMIILFLSAIAVIILGFMIKGATECAAKGGTYITGQAVWPACVQGVR